MRSNKRNSPVKKNNGKQIVVEPIYKNITKLIDNIIDNNPLSNELPLSEAIESRITVLSKLCNEIAKQYSTIDYSWFLFKLHDLKEAIHSFAKFLENLEISYEDLEGSLDTAARYHVRLFPISLDKYLNDTRREIIKDFNEFISKGSWLVFKSASKKSYKQLPLADKLKIPEDVI